MTHFKVTMEELGSDGTIHTLTQDAICESRQKVIEFYGLNQPDILSYNIEIVE